MEYSEVVANVVRKKLLRLLSLLVQADFTTEDFRSLLNAIACEASQAGYVLDFIKQQERENVLSEADEASDKIETAN